MDLYCPPRKKLRISSLFELRRDEKSKLEEKKLSIQSFPNECLFEIFRRLPGSARSTCACVSKRWLFVLSSIRKSELCNSSSEQDPDTVSFDEVEEAGDGHLTRCLEGKKATDLRLLAITVGTAAHGGLGKLSIRGNNSSRAVTNLGLSAMARGCPSLRSLSLWNVSFIGDKGACDIANGCPVLEKIDFRHCPSITDKGFIAIAQNCPNLTSLTIESCPLNGNDCLQAVARYCSKLESVSLKNCPLIGDQGIASLLSSPSLSLTKLKMSGLSISDFGLATIGHYGKSILNLFLCNLKNVSEKGFLAMVAARGLQSLLSLTVTSCTGLTDLGLEAIAKGCVCLEQISLLKCCFVSDTGLAAFYISASSIESLHLEENNRVTLSGIISALSNCGSKLKTLALVNCMGIKDMVSQAPFSAPCRSLRSLSIQNCPGFGSVGLAVLGRMFPEIRHIDLSGLYGITDEGLLSLLQSRNVGLVKVNLNGCINLCDKAVAAMATLHGETIKVLNLEGCRKITDLSLEAIAQSCTQLIDLDLSSCAITDRGVGALSSTEQLSLQILSLSGCSGITGKSLPYLMKLGESLSGLNLKHCGSISGGEIDLLMDSLWRCDILF